MQLLLIFLAFGVFVMSTAAQHNTNLINHSATDNTTTTNASAKEVILDSDIKLDEALHGQKIPASVKENLTFITVHYYGFDNKLHRGQLVVHKKVAKEIEEIFKVIQEIHFPVEKVIPISKYRWSDNESMNNNNTSCFNYRFISGSKILSKHANGLAIDINPKQNPYVKNGKTSPDGSVYDVSAKGTITSDSQIVKEFKKRGWTWGGDWKSLKDYQHFQKELTEDK